MSLNRILHCTINSMKIQGGFSVERGIELLRNANVVILDVDSTLIRKEGIDMLASYKNMEAEIKSLKNRIINGELEYADFTRECLSILRPSKDDCSECIKQQKYDIVNDAPEFIQACQKLGKDVYLVSGGYVPMITPLLPFLGIESSHLFAIPLFFSSTGAFAGYDSDAYTAQMDGKAVVANKLRNALPGGKGIVVNIGDGILDANAYPASDSFIGFTGVVFKERALKKSMMYVNDFAGLIEIVNN